MEIRRFGIGHRRHDGPPGTHGVEATPVHVDDRGVVAELALKPNAAIAPHSNPNLAYFLVIEGGGFVQVGDERARVAAGEAVVWPPDVVHSAWTELTPMRAIVVEFAATGATATLLLEGGSTEPSPGDGPGHRERGPADPGHGSADGELAPEPEVPPPIACRPRMSPGSRAARNDPRPVGAPEAPAAGPTYAAFRRWATCPSRSLPPGPGSKGRPRPLA
ncbi:MAG: cupin domain-containing protein [Candidatus Limnocylindrales bacterium]